LFHQSFYSTLKIVQRGNLIKVYPLAENIIWLLPCSRVIAGTRDERVSEIQF